MTDTKKEDIVAGVKCLLGRQATVSFEFRDVVVKDGERVVVIPLHAFRGVEAGVNVRVSLRPVATAPLTVETPA